MLDGWIPSVRGESNPEVMIITILFLSVIFLILSLAVMVLLLSAVALSALCKCKSTDPENPFGGLRIRSTVRPSIGPNPWREDWTQSAQWRRIAFIPDFHPRQITKQSHINHASCEVWSRG